MCAAKRRQIVAKGMRNPFRLGISPVSGDIVVGDVGLETAESIKVVPNPLRSNSTSAAGIDNYGWPCIEGNAWIPPYTNE